jgi:hypothetical protein
MPKKEVKEETPEKLTFKSLLNQLMQNSMQSLITVAAQEAEHLVRWIQELGGIGKKIRKLLTTVILFSAGLGVLGIGAALYIKELFPELSQGITHILVGLVIISVAAMYSKFAE